MGPLDYGTVRDDLALAESALPHDRFPDPIQIGDGFRRAPAAQFPLPLRKPVHALSKNSKCQFSE